MIYIGAEHILSPLGNSASENFKKALKGASGINAPQVGFDFVKTPVSTLSNFDLLPGYSKIESMCISSALSCIAAINNTALSDKWLFILSTTKGDIDHLAAGNITKAKPTYLANRVVHKLPISADVMVVSNACISGLLAAITAHDLIASGKYSHAIVVGVDVVTKFIASGFESFYALSDTPTKPFDKDRTGLTIGEAVSSVVLSESKNIFKEIPLLFSGGASANDANHISGPSRTGEGLFRAITSAIKIANVQRSDIDFISGHGTGTRFNDDMESIAFTRCGLNKVPLNSFKGYFGHTFGAAGVLELSMTMQSMRNGIMLKTLGCENPQTTNDVNVLVENMNSEVNLALKTASGFGGCNAAAILKNVKA